MKRMTRNFPSSNGMDRNFANMRSLIQVLDPELYDLMRANGDYTHFYFCYRWFLLDFKRGMNVFFSRLIDAKMLHMRLFGWRTYVPSASLQTYHRGLTVQ